MHQEEFDFTREDGCSLLCRSWQPPSPAKAQVLIAHGMAEHSARYQWLASQLVAQGVGVYAYDQRGHGAHAQLLGHFADENGWHKVINDLHDLAQHIRQAHPNTALVLLGHSMGSYIGQAYLLRYSHEVDGAILSGSNYQPTALYRTARAIARLERWRLGLHGRSQLINYLSFGSFNKAFKPNRTAFDWLSRDDKQVDAYVTDPLCGFVCTTGLWCDLLQGLIEISQPLQLKSIRSDLPLLIIGGDQDPVSAGKRLRDLHQALRHAGLKHCELQLYPGARHEVFNETNREQVAEQLCHWLTHLPAITPASV